MKDIFEERVGEKLTYCEDCILIPQMTPIHLAMEWYASGVGWLACRLCGHRYAGINCQYIPHEFL